MSVHAIKISEIWCICCPAPAELVVKVQDNIFSCTCCCMLYLVSCSRERLNTQPHVAWTTKVTEQHALGMLSIILLKSWGGGWGRIPWLAGCSKPPYFACGSHSAAKNLCGQTSRPHVPSSSPSTPNLGIQLLSWPLPLPLSLAAQSLAVLVYFSITRAFPSNRRSICRDMRNFSLAFWQRRESGQNCFPKLSIKGGNSTEIIITIKTRILGLGSLLPRDLCSYFFHQLPELHYLWPPAIERTTCYSHSPIFCEQYRETLMVTDSRSSP